MLSLESDAWINGQKTKATNDYPPPPYRSCSHRPLFHALILHIYRSNPFPTFSMRSSCRNPSSSPLPLQCARAFIAFLLETASPFPTHVFM